MFEKGAIINSDATLEDGREAKFKQVRIDSLFLLKEQFEPFENLVQQYFYTTRPSAKHRIAMDFGSNLGSKIKDLISKYSGSRHLAGSFFASLMEALSVRGYDVEELIGSEGFLIAIKKHLNQSDKENVIDSGMVGARSVVSFIKSLEKNKNIVFVGSNIALDTRYSIDIVVGLDNSKGVTDGHPTIDELQLVQIKTSQPREDEVGKILENHRRYATLLRRLVLGRPARSLIKNIKKFCAARRDGTPIGPGLQDFIQQTENILEFVANNFSSSLDFDDFMKICTDHGFDPAIVYSYTTQLDEAYFADIISNEDSLYKLKQAKDVLNDLFIPQEFIGAENRRKKEHPHIASAVKIKTVITVGENVIYEAEI